jgi:hypothetical protein
MAAKQVAVVHIPFTDSLAVFECKVPSLRDGDFWQDLLNKGNVERAFLRTSDGLISIKYVFRNAFRIPSNNSDNKKTRVWSERNCKPEILNSRASFLVDREIYGGHVGNRSYVDVLLIRSRCDNNCRILLY